MKLKSSIYFSFIIGIFILSFIVNQVNAEIIWGENSIGIFIEDNEKVLEPGLNWVTSLVIGIIIVIILLIVFYIKQKKPKKGKKKLKRN